ncbi:hypothetical protein N7535_004742 [Penicillium sp. DV-2018c]|nr:hypothetical protein N7461_008325 [Penicillium sp. DV-2018c]KAJ5571082.1 hypothetical protein N7535_004742 [Penicillium sp. DV-2018c]
MQAFGPEYTQFAVAALTKGIAELSPDQVHRMLEWRYPGISYLWHASINQIVLSTAVRYLLHQNSPFSDCSDFVLPVPLRSEEPLSGIVLPETPDSTVSLVEEPTHSTSNPAVSLADHTVKTAREASEEAHSEYEGAQQAAPSPPSTPPVQPSVVLAPAALATPTTIVITQTAIPAPGTASAPAFDEKNATEFLQRVQDMCTRSGMHDVGQMMTLLPQYCSRTSRVWVEKRTSWKTRNWEEFKEEFLEYFYDGDSDQQRYTRQYLEGLVRVRRDIEGNNRGYLNEFDDVSGELVQRGELEDCDRADLFFRGLPDKWKVKIIKHHSAKDLPRQRRITYSEAYRQVNKYHREQTNLRRYLSSPEPQNVQTEPQPGNGQVHQQDQSHQQAPNGGIEEPMNELQSQMADLALEVQTPQNRSDPTRQGPLGSLGVRAPMKCFTCGGPHRSKSNSCPTIREFLDQGVMHFDTNGRMVLGTQDQPGPELRVHRDVLRMHSIRQQFDEWTRGSALRPNIGTRFAQNLPMRGPVPGSIPCPVPSVDAPLNEFIGAGCPSQDPDTEDPFLRRTNRAFSFSRKG